MLAVDATLLIVFFIVWILLLVLNKVFFNPLRNVLTEREKTIKANLKAIEVAQSQYEENIGTIEDKLKAARLEAKETREQLTADAVREKERILLEIGQECRERVVDAKERLEKKVEELKKDLLSESKVLSEKIEQRLLH